MKAPRGPLRLEKLALIALLLAVASLVTVPSVFGSSTGMNSENAAFPAADFDAKGCTACHGGAAFAVDGADIVYTLADAEGTVLHSAQYEAGETYTITVTLNNELAPEEANHAGFYLSATGGEFVDAGDANVQITGGGLEASHTNAGETTWTVGWTAPESGAIAFSLLVNDVDGSGAPDEADQVYRQYFALTDHDGAQLGAVEEEEIEFGVALPQYWLGLIALASMTFVMLFAFVYLKFVSPHNSDAKDR